jgi:hypothetical protein
MKTAAKILLPAVLLALTACGPKRPKGPDWALSAPPGTVMAVSGQAGWVIQQRELQSLLGRFPLAEQTLDLFLKRARINPQGETGRISLFVMDLQLDASKPQGGIESSNFLLQLGGFRDPKNLLIAVTEAFPMEGTLQVGKRELPLYVLFDFNQFHMRLLFDEQDRIWIGDLPALASLGREKAKNPMALRATEWIDGRAPVQGLLFPENLLKQASEKLPKAFAMELPKGIQALAWSVSPGAGKDASHLFELAITGSPEGIQQVSPWVQRLVAFLSSMPGAPSRPADVLEERNRVGLRAHLSSAQLEAVMARIAQPGLFKAFNAQERKP